MKQLPSRLVFLLILICSLGFHSQVFSQKKVYVIEHTKLNSSTILYGWTVWIIIHIRKLGYN